MVIEANKYRIMTKDEFTEKYGSMANVENPLWNSAGGMDEYFGAVIKVDIDVGEHNRFRVPGWSGYRSWVFNTDWLVEIKRTSKPKQSSSNLKLINNVIIKLDQNK